MDEEKDVLLPETSNTSSSSLRHDQDSDSRRSHDTISTTSTTSLVLENLNINSSVKSERTRLSLDYSDDYRDDNRDPEKSVWIDSKKNITRGMSKTLKRMVWIVSILALLGWGVALFTLLSTKKLASSQLAYDHASPSKNNGKRITMDQLQRGTWQPERVNLNWIAGADGEDGLLLEVEQPGKDYLVVEDVRSRQADTKQDAYPSKILMRSGWFAPKNKDGTRRGQVWAQNTWPSPDLKKVLIISNTEKVYRHSSRGQYYLFDVQTQSAELLDPDVPDGKVQLARWSPKGDAVAFTRDNNLYVRMIRDVSGNPTTAVRQVTRDGGPEYFYGIPDWVYEEEVFQNNIATWWDREGKYIAFMRTNETVVPEYPVDYYIDRKGRPVPKEGLETYPEEVRIKYPKAGAPNPFVDMLFYDLEANEMFDVKIDNGFADDDRIIGDVTWADDGKCLIKELNRESDHLRLTLIDVRKRSGKVVRSENLQALDGGWIEPAQTARYIPADPNNDRPHEGYVDMVVYQNNDHLAYFSPLDSDKPIMLTQGDWEVEVDTDAIDLRNNMVYFAAAKKHSTQRHIYGVSLTDKDKKILPIVPTSEPGFYSASFSALAGYAKIDYQGPNIPSQYLISTPANQAVYNETLTTNDALAKLAATHELPHLLYSNITVAGNVTINVVEQRPRHFDPRKQYPVLFQLYGGPNSQQVTRKFQVNFQSYVAATLGYIVVTVDGRGTGFLGRAARTCVRGHLGKYEAEDQIAVAKIWANKQYVDENAMAIWGWSYGGFMTLKVLETDAGRTFKYGVAVAPVTDWRFYDSIYTERYMLTPQHNPVGYIESAISNTTALSKNVRFLVMHGTGDDNVHLQNTLTLLDKLDQAGVRNYDTHFFPDSDHSIYFHGANSVVYGKLAEFLVNAFEGTYYKMRDPLRDRLIEEEEEEEANN